VENRGEEDFSEGLGSEEEAEVGAVDRGLFYERRVGELF
jgi:hypothetical protein